MGFFLNGKETITFFGSKKLPFNVSKVGQSYHQIQQNLTLFPKMQKSGFSKMCRLGFSSQWHSFIMLITQSVNLVPFANMIISISPSGKKAKRKITTEGGRRRCHEYWLSSGFWVRGHPTDLWCIFGTEWKTVSTGEPEQSSWEGSGNLL